MTKTKRAIRLNVYTPPYGECSNHGITHYHNDVLVLCDNGPINIDLDNPPDNLMKLDFSTIGGNIKTLHLIPYTMPEGLIGPMAGGCYASTSDARWHRLLATFIGDTYMYIAQAVPIHDRFETPEQYDVLSR